MGLRRGVVSFMAVAAMLMSMASAATYTVGDADGWSSGIDYTTWISGKTFNVGDKLVFTYMVNHDVLEVSQPDYESCVTSSPITTENSGSTTVSLTAAGKRYFICGTIGHCDQGMKIEIDTLGSSSSPPPPAVTSPPPAANPPPSSPATPPPVATPPPSSTPATPPRAFTPPPTSTPASPPTSSPSPPPKAQSPKSAPTVSPPAKSPTSTPKAKSPSPSVSKVAPTPQPSSACKISYAASFAFALTMLAAI